MNWDDGATWNRTEGGGVARKPGYLSPSVARRAMQRQELTGIQVAARVGVNPSTVRNWLAGRTAPTPAKLADLASVLGLDVRDLTAVVPGRETLGDLRIHAALTQSEVATLVGLSQSAYSAIEQGGAALSDVLCGQLAEAYDSSPEEIRAAWTRARDTLKGLR